LHTNILIFQIKCISWSLASSNQKVSFMQASQWLSIWLRNNDWVILRDWILSATLSGRSALELTRLGWGRIELDHWLAHIMTLPIMTIVTITKILNLRWTVSIWGALNTHACTRINATSSWLVQSR
jgi:hypothetical protein